MPELPEVETLKRELKKVLLGKKIKRVLVWEKKIITLLSGRQINSLIVGRKISGLSRRAKILIIDLNDKNHLLIHLKMTGQLIYQPAEARGKMVAGGHPQPGGLDNLPNRFTRLALEFTDGARLYFNDMRKFGWIRYVPGHQKENILKLNGVEPLAKEFTSTILSALLKKYPKRKIKSLLLDQSVVAGLGNIYADESLFIAGIRPSRPASKITKARIIKLHQAIKDILKLSIKKKGTSFRNFRRSTGQPGGFVPYLKVYGRDGQFCQVCGQSIKKIRLAGRGACFCPRCQK